MRLRSLQLTNFMGIDDMSIALDAPVVALVGDNGSGKSSILKAARVAVGAWLYGAGDGGAKAPSIEAWMRHHRLRRLGFETVIEYPGAVEVRAEGCVASQVLRWSIARDSAANSRSRWTGSRELTELASALTSSDEAAVSAHTLPLMAYFGARRASAARLPPGRRGKGPEPRTRAYLGALDSSVETAHLLDRWARLDSMATRNEDAAVALEGLQRCLTLLVPGATEVRFDHDLAEPIVCVDHAHWQPLTALSDGFRSMLEIGMDLALRAQQLNPQLGAYATDRTPGVVIIDEVGQHLHPGWQAEVLSGLRRAFPMLQFLVATHSPFVVMNLEADAIVYRTLVNHEVDRGRVTAERLEVGRLGTSVDAVLRGDAFGPLVTWSRTYLGEVQARAQLLQKVGVLPTDLALADSTRRLEALRGADVPTTAEDIIREVAGRSVEFNRAVGQKDFDAARQALLEAVRAHRAAGPPDGTSP